MTKGTQHPEGTELQWDAAIITAAPLQVLSLLEAVDRFSIDIDRMTLFATSGALRMTEAVGLRVPDSRVIPFVKSSSSRHLYQSIRECSLEAKSFATERQASRAFLGFDGILTRAMYWAGMPHLPAYILEDGTASLSSRSKSLRFGDTEAHGVKELMRHAARALYGLRTTQPSIEGYFSPFELEVPSHTRLIHNDFRVLRASTRPTEDRSGDRVLLLGSYAVSNQALEEAVRMIARRHPTAQVLFKPHPSGMDQAVPSPAVTLAGSDARTPVELLMMRMIPVPHTVYGFGSSALLTLRSLFGEDVICVDLEVHE